MNYLKLNFFVLLTPLLFSINAYPNNFCKNLFIKTDFEIKSDLQTRDSKLDHINKKLFGQNSIPSSDIFEFIAERIISNKEVIIKHLTDVDNYYGAKYEIEQSIKTLRGVKIHELEYLKTIDGLKNVAVYGSTNIPLYTLILHGLIPASTGANIWFRTPQASRQTYLKLMSTIKNLLPEFDLSNLHILSEPQDVQYDYFRKQYVLGLNRKGTRYLRDPSEVVIFTGKPETGDEIVLTISKKIQEMRVKDQRHIKILFLKFGSGLNPVLITNRAEKLIHLATNATVEAIKINTSQDCIAPKLYIVHESMLNNFTDLLLNKLKNLKFGKNNDTSSDYGPLTFKEDFSGLVNFRTKWRNYLVTGNSIISPEEKRVDPHLFIFPFEKFKDVELEDHFAPFVILFKYENESQLEVIANDSRIKRRAMFASIFSDSSDYNLFKIRKLFEDNFHSTILNQSVFTEESGNFPFGGYSKDASSSTLLISNENTEMQIKTSNRPILFSKEVSLNFTQSAPHFHSNESKPTREENNSTKANAFLTKILENSFQTLSNNSSATGPNNFIVEPVNTIRKGGINSIRNLIKRDGLKVVVYKHKPRNSREEQRDRFFYGPNILYFHKKAPSLIRVKGVVLHPSFIGDESLTYNSYRGDLNPHLGFANLNQILSRSKLYEYQMANAIWPDAIPQSKTYGEFLETVRDFDKVEYLRKKLAQKFNDLANEPNRLSKNRAKLIDEATLFLELFFNLVNKNMPEGAFIKNYGESTTGDLGNQITTFSQNSRNYVLQFIERLESHFKIYNHSFYSTDISTFISNIPFETGSKMLIKLLLNPNDLLIQKRVKIAKTNLGFPMEIRVDFLEGTAINSRPRYTHEYLRPQMNEAEKFLNQFFKRAPTELRMLSGGADLVKLESGQWVFMEFNVGSGSGSIKSEVFPIDTNIFLTRLQDHPTPLIQWLESTFRAGIDAQKKLLLKAGVEKEQWHKESIDDISLAEFAKYFRDRYLDEWSSNPTRENGIQTLLSIKTLFEDLGSESNRDLPLLKLGAELYINNSLEGRGENPI